MNKAEFLRAVALGIRALPEIDVARSLDYYEEIIDDRMEDGMTEEEAVAAMGSPEDAAREILQNIPASPAPVPEQVPQKGRSGFWPGFLIALASPLLLVYFILVLSLLILLWCVPIVLWALFVSSVAAAVSGVVSCGGMFIDHQPLYAVFYLGMFLFGTGLGVFLYFASVAVTKGIARLTVRIARGCVRPFRRKEE